MSTHTYRTVDVPVAGGDLRVGVWEPASIADAEVPGAFDSTRASESSPAHVPSVLAIHGVTASHLAWQFVVDQLPGVRLIAPDLRGRGQSADVEGPAGMATHARDLVAVLDHFGIESLPVLGHSMGGFVSVVMSHLAPERVDRLMLIDGGLPLDAPAGISAEDLVAAILGPTAERLSKRFDTTESYLSFWRAHPAFQEWSAELDEYFTYDLVADGEQFRPATSLATTTEDTVDLNTGTALVDALGALPGFGKPIHFITVPRGLQNEAPGLYAPAHLARLLEAFPCVDHDRLDDLNHYTVVMSARGAERIGPLLRAATSVATAQSTT
ncbi:alpha/beta fold hydrolase [Leucobacter denitrificans]|uniref:Alpha/beta hydrolase n=1 Tax=Leucobacter denitrificans TaxID=683042 RepID=A0A7G9S274_9MICO|nr:alpha/beta hydrolase [Leucobacter denitrificans]QNN61949.1 alpha/beta hydrolase [Leucobacter denitrificans]